VTPESVGLSISVEFERIPALSLSPRSTEEQPPPANPELHKKSSLRALISPRTADGRAPPQRYTAESRSDISSGVELSGSGPLPANVDSLVDIPDPSKAAIRKLPSRRGLAVKSMDSLPLMMEQSGSHPSVAAQIPNHWKRPYVANIADSDPLKVPSPEMTDSPGSSPRQNGIILGDRSHAGPHAHNISPFNSTGSDGAHLKSDSAPNFLGARAGRPWRSSIAPKIARSEAPLVTREGFGGVISFVKPQPTQTPTSSDAVPPEPFPMAARTTTEESDQSLDGSSGSLGKSRSSRLKKKLLINTSGMRREFTLKRSVRSLPAIVRLVSFQSMLIYFVDSCCKRSCPPKISLRSWLAA